MGDESDPITAVAKAVQETAKTGPIESRRRWRGRWRWRILVPPITRRWHLLSFSENEP